MDPVTHSGNTSRHDQQMAEESRFSLDQGNVGEHSLLPIRRDPVVFVKRPVRTRMRGAVGFLLPTNIKRK